MSRPYWNGCGWGGSILDADFTPAGGSLLHADYHTIGSVTFAANQDRVSIVLRPNQNGVAQSIEPFSVQIIDGQNYQGIPANLKKAVDLSPKMSYYLAQRITPVAVLKGVTLFGGQNAIAAQQDNDPSGIDINDIKQGNVGDCYFLATVGALIRQDPKLIQRNMRDNGDGTVTVRFYGEGLAAADVTVSMTSDRGYAQAYLSLDTDANGNVEIWTIVLEKAYAKFKGGWDKIGEGGQCAAVYANLTGKPLGGYEVNGPDRWGWLRDANGPSRAAVLTIPPAANPQAGNGDGTFTTSAGQTLPFNHDLTIVGFGRGGEFLLYNPHGEYVTITWRELRALQCSTSPKVWVRFS